MNSEQQAELLREWYDATLRSYFPSSEAEFRSNAGFQNPVGQTLQESLGLILQGLIKNADSRALATPLDRVIRMLVVQGLSAGAAVRFLFLRRNLAVNQRGLDAADRPEWRSKIEMLAEMAVEIWCECRDTLSRLQIQELRQRIRLVESEFSSRVRGEET